MHVRLVNNIFASLILGQCATHEKHLCMTQDIFITLLQYEVVKQDVVCRLFKLLLKPKIGYIDLGFIKFIKIK